MKKLIFSVFAILMVFMLAGCGLKGQLFNSTWWNCLIAENAILNLHFDKGIAGGNICYKDIYGNMDSPSLTQSPYTIDGDQLTLNLKLNGEPVLVGTYTAEVKNKKLTLTDSDGEVLILERGSRYF